MCGIVGATGRREISEILLRGLQRLEYRGYDSAGMAVVDNEQNLMLHKQRGKVAALERSQFHSPILGCTGIAHTRWATHGEPSSANAHPHVAGDRLALVHNGIIENYEELRSELLADDVDLLSATDSELVVHLIYRELMKGLRLLEAVQQVLPRLEGAYAIAVVDTNEVDTIIAARQGSPLVVGVGIGENFLASDQLALRQVTDNFIYLAEGDVVALEPGALTIWDTEGNLVDRERVCLTDTVEDSGRGDHDHYMYKEIYEQPRALADTLGDVTAETLDTVFGETAAKVFDQVEGLHIVACGTSFHAGLVARYWLEEIARIPCYTEVASEFRYRKRMQHPGTLLLTISQSGETADTLAALRGVDDNEFLASLAVVNAPNSALGRESSLTFHTRAGEEIGVASTKAFTTQLLALILLTLALGKRRGLSNADVDEYLRVLRLLPDLVEETLALDPDIKAMAECFVDKHHALFLGRGINYPIGKEGALKLKEISYIHAEAYPAGELKHGPLALVDNDMPVVAIAPNDLLLSKLKSNLEEVRARGGELYVFADASSGFRSENNIHVLEMPSGPEVLMPYIYTVGLQLLSYHVAVMRGTDVDQPRNLAKSVTVE